MIQRFALATVITVNALWAANAVKTIPFTLRSSDTYQCSKNGVVQIDLYGNADQSLFFIKTNIQKQKITLAQLASASGMRFSDDFSWNLSLGGKELGIERKNEDGKFELIEVCQQSPRRTRP